MKITIFVVASIFSWFLYEAAIMSLKMGAI